MFCISHVLNVVMSYIFLCPGGTLAPIAVSLQISSPQSSALNQCACILLVRVCFNFNVYQLSNLFLSIRKGEVKIFHLVKLEKLMKHHRTINKFSDSGRFRGKERLPFVKRSSIFQRCSAIIF